MLCPKCDEVVHRGTVIPLDVGAKELSSLGESNCIEAILELGYARNLFSGEVDLFVHISVLQNFGERSEGL